MSSIKKLAGDTVWYGASNIFARFLNVLLTPYLTHQFIGTTEFGKMSLIYSLIPFLYTLTMFGFETAYFRYIQKKEHEKDVYNTILTSLFISTTIITTVTILFRKSIAAFIGIDNHPEYITIGALIIALDTISTIPFAKLRHENKPRKYAFIRAMGIIINIIVTFFFLSVFPSMYKKHPDSILLFFYSAGFGVGYVLIGNLSQSIFQFIVLLKEISLFKWELNKKLWTEIVVYSLPLTIAGFGGIVNETFDRVMLQKWLPLPKDAATYQVGVYSACYKLSLLISLFIQAFRLGAEPFFFKQANSEGAQKVYARVMKFFVIVVTTMFLVVALYVNIWKQLIIRDPKMWEGLKIVPILLFANIFLGIYYNLSIWYRLSHKTAAGAYITLIGAAITLFVNYFFIPRFGYMASAWATFLCYGTMMVISYKWGQKAYRIPYATKKLIAYMVIVTLFYFLHHFLTGLWKNSFFSFGLASVFTLAYILFVMRIERKEFQKLPYIGKYVK
ncbi:MAG: oligosaccharide flippase family protein [Bacteroidetes bacterium]|nr:oligosaccharide flippase family protein [Bacteroidota bacterium]